MNPTSQAALLDDIAIIGPCPASQSEQVMSSSAPPAQCQEGGCARGDKARFFDPMASHSDVSMLQSDTLASHIDIEKGEGEKEGGGGKGWGQDREMGGGRIANPTVGLAAQGGDVCRQMRNRL
jgi:hypothetical protein